MFFFILDPAASSWLSICFPTHLADAAAIQVEINMELPSILTLPLQIFNSRNYGNQFGS